MAPVGPSLHYRHNRNMKLKGRLAISWAPCIVLLLHWRGFLHPIQKILYRQICTLPVLPGLPLMTVFSVFSPFILSNLRGPKDCESICTFAHTEDYVEFTTCPKPYCLNHKRMEKNLDTPKSLRTKLYLYHRIIKVEERPLWSPSSKSNISSFCPLTIPIFIQSSVLSFMTFQ